MNVIRASWSAIRFVVLLYATRGSGRGGVGDGRGSQGGVPVCPSAPGWRFMCHLCLCSVAEAGCFCEPVTGAALSGDPGPSRGTRPGSETGQQALLTEPGWHGGGSAPPGSRGRPTPDTDTVPTPPPPPPPPPPPAPGRYRHGVVGPNFDVTNVMNRFLKDQVQNRSTGWSLKNENFSKRCCSRTKRRIFKVEISLHCPYT